MRKVDKVLDLNFVYELVEDKYCLDNGRPSIDPVILVKILLIQRLFGIKSMRLTIKEIETNVAYRWYLGFSFFDKVPHYGTFSKNYTRRFYDTDLFEQIFERILEIAIMNNLIDHSTLFIDSTHIKANANKNKYINQIVKKDTLHFQEELNNEINQQRLAQGQTPSYRTINRFRINPIMDKLLQLLYVNFRTQLVEDNLIDEDSIYIDGAKIEASANKYTFVWRKNTERYNNKVFEQAKEIYCNAICNEIIPKLKDEMYREITIDELQNLEVSLETKIKDLNDEICNTVDVK